MIGWEIEELWQHVRTLVQRNENLNDVLNESDELKVDIPFVELLNFSDCEGFIGPKTSAKLHADFLEWDEKAKVNSNPKRQFCGSHRARAALQANELVSESAYFIDDPELTSIQHPRKRREIPEKFRLLAVLAQRLQKRLHPLRCRLGCQDHPLPLAQLVLLGGVVCNPARDIIQARLQAIRVPLDLVRDQVEHLQSGRIGRSRIIRHGRKFPHPLRGSYTNFIKSNTRPRS